MHCCQFVRGGLKILVQRSDSPANDFGVWSPKNSSFRLLSIDDRKSDALFKVSFTVLKQDSHFATSLLLQLFMREMNLLMFWRTPEEKGTGTVADASPPRWLNYR